MIPPVDIAGFRERNDSAFCNGCKALVWEGDEIGWEFDRANFYAGCNSGSTAISVPPSMEPDLHGPGFDFEGEVNPGCVNNSRACAIDAMCNLRQ